ncbi:MAG: hypothetical protein ACPLX7_02680 [Candidatus Kapaibacteriota bacterium]
MKSKLLFSLFAIVLSISMFSCKEKSTLEEAEDHTEAIGLTIYFNNKPYFKVINAQIDTTISKDFVVPYQQELTFEVKFITTDGDEVVPTESSKNFSWIIDDTTLVKASLLTGERFKFKMRGEKQGTTLIEFRLNHYDHPDFKTPKVPIVVK